MLARSSRSSVWAKKNRSAETMLFINTCFALLKQSLKAIEAIRKMIAEGYQHGSDLVWMIGYPAGDLLYSLARTGPVVPAHAGDDQERLKRSGSSSGRTLTGQAGQGSAFLS